MGVRFDRLADGSQGILERILTEKAKQAPQRPATDTAKPPLFTDTPTRVAPAPIQEALLGKDNGRARRGDDPAQLDSHTPLPKPMPFHSDADEFPDEAFEEATKVRALDELIAQTAESDTRPENTSRGRLNGRGDATVTDPIPDRAEQLKPMVLPSHPEPQEVPDLPNPPEFARPQPRLLDTSPSPRLESLPPSLPDALAKTRLGVEPARARVAPSTPPPPIAPIVSEVPPLPSGMRAVAHEQTEPARMPELKSRSMAPLLILIVLVVAAGGAAVWFFVLRQQVSESRDRGTATPSAGSAGSAAAAGPAVATGGSGSARVAGVPPPPANPTPAGPGSGAAIGSTAATDSGAKAETAETEIAASIEGATVELTGTDQSGPAPFTAKLEKGKAYKARITARGFATLEIDLKGGDPKQFAKLVAKPRFLNLSSEPSGAQITIDGTPTGRTTPSEIELTASQASKKSVRVVLRKSGFRMVDRSIDFAKFTDDDTRMTAKLDEKMSPAPANTNRPPPAAGSAKPPGPGSDTGNSAGSSDASAGSGSGTGQGAPADGPAAAPAPPPSSPSGAGSSSGSSAEPEPDFNKPK
jgi:hypothetical protein